MIADRINDIICRRESLPSLSDDEDLSCTEDQEVTEYSMQSSSRSLTSSRQKISSNSFRLLKKLPSSYGRKKLSKEATATKSTYQQDDDDVLSDDSCGIRNDIPSGSHDQDTMPIDEENNTLQLFDDDDNTNNDSLEKIKESAATSKRIKPSLGE